MRKIKDITFGKKYFITNGNSVMIFKGVDEYHYKGIWRLSNQSYVDGMVRPHSIADLKYFWFREATFKMVREYHINNRLDLIDYKWLRESFNINI